MAVRESAGSLTGRRARRVKGAAKEAVELTERVLARSWRERRFRAPLTVADGSIVQVVYPGRLGPGVGPDFRDALLTFDGRTLVRGDVEIHVRAKDWLGHRHHLDRAYDSVVLHLVGLGTPAPATRSDGTVVPSARLVPTEFGQDPSRFESPLPRVDRDSAAVALDDAGDRWLADRARSIEGSIDALGANQAIWRELLSALGYGGNRRAFVELSETVPWDLLPGMLGRGSAADRQARADALLQGASGLLASPEVLSLWRRLGAPAPLRPIAWRHTGLRPSNQPFARLRAAAALAARLFDIGLVEWLSRLSREAKPTRLVRAVVEAMAGTIGSGTASILVVNVVLPAFATLGVGEASWNHTFRLFPRLPENQITRTMTDLLFAPDARMFVSGARRQQGMLWVFRHWLDDEDQRDFWLPFFARVPEIGPSR